MQFELDVRAMSIGDFMLLMDNRASFLERIAVLERVTVGGVKRVPLLELPALLRAVSAALEENAGAGDLLKATLAHLWTSNTAPLEYVELLLCRDVYHCPPDALARQNAVKVLRHLTCLRAEAMVQKANARKLKTRSRSGRN